MGTLGADNLLARLGRLCSVRRSRSPDRNELKNTGWYNNPLHLNPGSCRFQRFAAGQFDFAGRE